MKKGDLFPIAGYPPKGLKAQYTGEKRQPKRGEWFLSGAIIEAYQAKNDLSTIYHIAEIVKVKRVITETITVIS
jgi:hypothetical protein